MKPIDLENAILAVMQRGSLAGQRGATIEELHRRVSPVGSGVSWRLVANAIYRLERQGLVHIIGDELRGDTSIPKFSLAPAGELEARRVTSLDPAMGMPPKAAKAGEP